MVQGYVNMKKQGTCSVVHDESHRPGIALHEKSDEESLPRPFRAGRRSACNQIKQGQCSSADLLQSQTGPNLESNLWVHAIERRKIMKRW